MPVRFFYVGEDEHVLLKQRAAPSYMLVLLLLPALVLTALLGLALTARAMIPEARIFPPWIAWLVWVILLGLVSLFAWRRAATTEHALTDQRVYARVGRFVTQLHFTTHDKITDIRYRQGPVERLLGLASLTFATAGAEVHVPGVRDALALKAASESARDAFVRSLLQDAPPAALAAPASVASPSWDTPPLGAPQQVFAARPAFPAYEGPRPDYMQAGDAPVWFARPRPIALVGGLRSLLGLIPLLFVLGALDPTRRVIAIGAGLSLAVLFMATRLLQLKRTEYFATNKRVYTRRGLIGTTVSQLTYDKITDITYSQDLLGRLFGYGTVRVQTAGSNQAPIAMIGLADPLAAKETIEHMRDAALENGR